jgi:cell division protein FtsI (penicillin-binding protein 3)
MSIGYAIDVTPLQLLVAYGAFANGGLLMQPFIIAEHRDMYGQTIWAAQPDSIRRVFKKETRQILLPSFEDVITDGTAKTARIDSLRIAGKTGTAQKAVNGRYVPGKYRGSFIGFFPAEKPEVVMLVVMDEPHNGFYGGTVAAPVFQRIAKRWIGTFPKIASKMAPAEPLPVVPSVEEKPVRVAALTTSEDEGKLPDFVGLSSREAVAWLTARGIKVQLQGRGRIKKQYPAAGRPVSNRVVLTGWQD